MTTLQKLEDLRVCQKTRLLNNTIYPLTFIKPICSGHRIKDQIRGAVGSLIDISGDFERDSKLESINFFTTAKEEAEELKSQLYKGSGSNYFSEGCFHKPFQLS